MRALIFMCSADYPAAERADSTVVVELDPCDLADGAATLDDSYFGAKRKIREALEF